MLLDLNDPSRVLARSEEPILQLAEDYEKNGFFGQVVFSNAHLVDGDELTLYYGALRFRRKHHLNLEPWAEPHYNGQSLGRYPIDCIVVDGTIPCVVMALKDGLSQFDLARAESYVGNLGLRFGVAVNFGKNELEIEAVSTL